MIKLYQDYKLLQRDIFLMCYAYSCRKALAEPLHEMLSMKLPAELFLACANCEKQEQKRQETVFFACRGLGQRPKNKKELSETRNKLKCKF